MGLEDFEQRIRQTLDETRSEVLSLSQRGQNKEAIKALNLGAKSLRAIKSEIMLEEREIRATATEHRQSIAGQGQLLGMFLGSRGRGALARGRQGARRQLARNETKVLAPYERLRNEIQRNLAVLDRLKVELSRPASSTQAQLASAHLATPAADGLSGEGSEGPSAHQPQLPMSSAASGSDVSDGRTSSFGRTVKKATLAAGAFFILLVVVGLAAGNKKGHASESGTAASSADSQHAAAKPMPTLQQMLDDLNSSLSADWKKPPADAIARCTPACRNLSAIYRTSTDICMKLCGSAENSSQIACFAKARTKEAADKCPSFAARPPKFLVGGQRDVVVIDELTCNLDLLKKLVGGDRGLGQAFAPYHVRQLRCSDGKTALDITYDK